jgi:hypothetical protein
MILNLIKLIYLFSFVQKYQNLPKVDNFKNTYELSVFLDSLGKYKTKLNKLIFNTINLKSLYEKNRDLKGESLFLYNVAKYNLIKNFDNFPLFIDFTKILEKDINKFKKEISQLTPKIMFMLSYFCFKTDSYNDNYSKIFLNLISYLKDNLNSLNIEDIENIVLSFNLIDLLIRRDVIDDKNIVDIFHDDLVELFVTFYLERKKLYSFNDDKIKNLENYLKNKNINFEKFKRTNLNYADYIIDLNDIKVIFILNLINRFLLF